MEIIPQVSPVQSELMPTARANGVLIPYDPENHIFLLIGGSDRSQAFSDIWLLNMKEKNWKPIKEIPSFTSMYTPRSGVSYSLISNTKEELLLCIHGGQDFFTQTFFSDLIFLKINKNNYSLSTITNTTILPLDLNKNPCERNSHCMLYAEDLNKIFIFGGGCKDSLLNDLWSLDFDFNLEGGKNNLYTKVEIDKLNQIIKPRELFGMVYHEKKIYIFGGRLMDEIDKNSYIIDLENKTCKKGSKLPFCVCAFAFVKVKIKNEFFVIIYGGTDGNLFSNSFVVYDFKNDIFRKSNYIINKDLVNNDPTFSVFLGRISAMMSFDEQNESVIIYGGSACDKEWNFINEVKVKDILDGLK